MTSSSTGNEGRVDVDESVTDMMKTFTGLKICFELIPTLCGEAPMDENTQTGIPL